MQKRAQIEMVLWSAVALIVSAMIILAYADILPGSANKGILERGYITKDLALIIGTIYSASGDVEYVYVVPYRVKMSIQEGTVTASGETGSTTSQFGYNPAIILNPFTSDTPPIAIRIRRTGGTIMFSGIYDEKETEATQNFREFVQFVNGNGRRKYDFDCREEISIGLAKGYYVSVSDGGAATLLFNLDGLSQVILKLDTEPLAHKETGKAEEFFISNSDWEPETAISRHMKGKVTLIHEGGKWSYAEPSIDVNELPECEAESLARKVTSS